MFVNLTYSFRFCKIIFLIFAWLYQDGAESVNEASLFRGREYTLLPLGKTSQPSLRL